MEWFVDDPHRGQIALTVIFLVIAAFGIWFGRKKLLVTIPALLVFLLIAAITVPSTIPARPIAQRNACIYNLRAIQDAQTEWARANSNLAPASPAEGDVFGTNGVGGILRYRPECPRGGIYTIGSVSQN